MISTTSGRCGWWRGDLERELVVLEHGGGDVQREVAAVGQAVLAGQREPDHGELELDADVDGVRVEEAALGRERGAVGVGEARERLGADDAAAGEVDDRLEGDVEPVAVDKPLHARADALAALGVERDALLVLAGALALGDEVRGQLVLELAQLLGDGDEADQQADGGDRELAGAQREAGPPRALVGLGGDSTRTRRAREDQQGQDAHVAPGHRAAGAAPPEGGDAGLRDHDERDERAHRGGEPAVGREIAERGGGNGGPGEEEGTQAAEDEQGAELGAHPASAIPAAAISATCQIGSARRWSRGSDRPAAVREHARQREQRRDQADQGDGRADREPGEAAVDVGRAEA